MNDLTHTDREGNKKLISQMSDTHLKNIIEMYLTQMETAKASLIASITSLKFKSALYGISDDQIEKKSGKLLRHHNKKLVPYLAEAMIRGISFTERLQKIHDRQGAEMLFAVEDGSRLLDFDDDDED